MCKRGTKTTPLVLTADGEASWSLLPCSVSLITDSTVQPENTYSSILRETGQVWETQKWISINTNQSYHHRSSSKASLNQSNNKARFSFNQPSRKSWSAKLVDVKHVPHKAFLWHHHWNCVEQALLDTNLWSLIFVSLSFFKIISYEKPNIGDIQTKRIWGFEICCAFMDSNVFKQQIHCHLTDLISHFFGHHNCRIPNVKATTSWNVVHCNFLVLMWVCGAW